MQNNKLLFGVAVFVLSLSSWLIIDYGTSKDEIAQKPKEEQNKYKKISSQPITNKEARNSQANSTVQTSSPDSASPNDESVGSDAREPKSGGGSERFHSKISGNGIKRKQNEATKQLNSLLSAWHFKNKENLFSAEYALTQALKQGNAEDFDKIATLLEPIDVELRHRVLSILANVSNELSFRKLNEIAQSEDFELRKEALEAIGNTQVSLGPSVTNSLKTQLYEAINRGDNSLVLALGRALSNGATAETTVQLIAMADDPTINEPISTALMQAVENAKSSDLATHVNQFLEGDPELTTNAAIATGNVLAKIQDMSSANALIQWAERANFDKVGEQARYWFTQLAQSSKIKSEFRDVNQFHEFTDPRMGNLIHQVGINETR